jgi:hypothetical protein
MGGETTVRPCHAWDMKNTDPQRYNFTRTGTFIVKDGQRLEVVTWEQDSDQGDGDRDFIIQGLPVERPCPYCAPDEPCALHTP